MEEEIESGKELVISPSELTHLLDRFIRMYQRAAYRMRTPATPNRGQLRVLRLIADNDGLNQKELAELMDVRSASMSEILTKLEQSGIIAREKDESDKRVTRLYLSEEGRQVLAGAQSRDDFAEMLFGTLAADDRSTFYKTLKGLCAHFEAQNILESNDDELLPPHLRDGHEPPPPHLRDGHEPLPPHLRDGHEPLPPHLRDGHEPPPHLRDGHEPLPTHLRDGRKSEL
jgi:DNA-binding MarR family transcriptional regulator